VVVGKVCLAGLVVGESVPIEPDGLQFHLSRAVFVGRNNERKLVWSCLPTVFCK
jgi:hypothetical protein